MLVIDDEEHDLQAADGIVDLCADENEAGGHVEDFLEVRLEERDKSVSPPTEIFLCRLKNEKSHTM